MYNFYHPLFLFDLDLHLFFDLLPLHGQACETPNSLPSRTSRSSLPETLNYPKLRPTKVGFHFQSNYPPFDSPSPPPPKNITHPFPSHMHTYDGRENYRPCRISYKACSYSRLAATLVRNHLELYLNLYPAYCCPLPHMRQNYSTGEEKAHERPGVPEKLKECFTGTWD